jgi:hypothetical protein
MAQIYGALALMGVYFAAALLMLLHDSTSLPDIARTCNFAGLSDGACHAAATNVAVQGLIAIVIAAAVTLGFTRKLQRKGVASNLTEPFDTAPALVISFLAAVAAVLTVHNVRHALTGLSGQYYRPAESTYVSIESLAWPLLLQLVIWSRQIHRQFLLVAFLAAITAISPFRNTILSILYFGALIPFVSALLVGRSLSRRAKLVSLSVLIVLVLMVSLLVLYQTGRRVDRTAYDANIELSQVAAVEHAMTSRALTPFFQAAMVERLVQGEQSLPGFLSSIAEKLHLGFENLNEYTFRVIYTGVGQTTTLYYGESVANTGIPPIFWEFSAPMALILLYFLLRPISDVSALFAVALWRSSMGGLFDVLTALLLQVAFCLVLTNFNSISNRLMRTRTLRYIRSTFVLGVLGMNLAVFTSPLWNPRWELRIERQSLAHETGHSYIVPVPHKVFPLFEIATDDLTHPQASSLALSENGTPLGPAHSLHNDIRAKGNGRFSYWNDYIYFSTSDGSDPRQNGRQYVAADRPHLIFAARGVAILLDFFLVILFCALALVNLFTQQKISGPASAE